MSSFTLELQSVATVVEIMNLALQHHQSGWLDEAERLCARVLEAVPEQVDALHLRGLIAHQRGYNEAALVDLQNVIQLAPNVAQFHNTLGVVYFAIKEYNRAEEHYRQAIQLDASYVSALKNFGTLCLVQNRYEEAASNYDTYLAHQPHDAVTMNNRASALRALGRMEAAVAQLERAVAADPNFAKAYNNLGAAFSSLGRVEEAFGAYQRAVQLSPNSAGARYNLGQLLMGLARYPDAVEHFEAAVEADPNMNEAHNNLGLVLAELQRHDESIEHFQAALQLAPENLAARNNLAQLLNGTGHFSQAVEVLSAEEAPAEQQALWSLRAKMLHPMVFSTERAVADYRTELLEFVRGFRWPATLPNANDVAAARVYPPFTLAFQGMDDRPLKEAFANVMREVIPSHTLPQSHGAPKVGIVLTPGHEGAFLRAMRGLLNGMQEVDFEIVLFCSSAARLAFQPKLQDGKVRFVNLPQRISQVAEVVSQEACDVLYFWEIGTDAVSYLLPFYRLAPVQFTSWGMPVTSGMQEVDYYVTSDLVEPLNSDTHYTESLIRLKTFPTFQARVNVPDDAKNRAALGLPESSHLYLCCQQLEKFHPEFDTVLGEILRRDPQGMIVAVEDKYGHARRALRERFDQSFSDVSERVLFLPRMKFDDYLSLIHHVDVILDPLHFGGALTTYDALSLGKAVVTTPGEFARERYTEACFRKMGETACIADTNEAYIDLAVRLGTDSSSRGDIEKAIRSTSDVLFEEQDAVDEFEALLRDLIQQAHSGAGA